MDKTLIQHLITLAKDGNSLAVLTAQERVDILRLALFSVDDCTCATCAERCGCDCAYDAYNTSGDCLAIK